jgi:hypothetical protein
MTILTFAGFSLVVAVALAYELRFTDATLQMGRSLAASDEGRGYQDAITPPASTPIGLVVYGLACAAVLLGFVSFGFWAGVGLTVAFVFIVGVVLALLPAATSAHFRRQIVASMCRRYADYLRDADPARADAMRLLLLRAGIPVDEVPEFTGGEARAERRSQ